MNQSYWFIRCSLGTSPRSVPHVIRAKGFRYHSMGAVVAISGGEWTAHAVVRGGRNYRVEITRDGDGFRASCDCAYFVDRARSASTSGPPSSRPTSGILLDGDGEPDDEAFLEPTSAGPTRGSAPTSRCRSRKRRRPWQRFLTDLTQRLDAGDRLTSNRRFVDGELLYAIDVAADASRTRRRPARPAPDAAEERRVGQAEAGGALSAQEVDDLPEPDDRDIHAQLLGAVDQAALQASYYGQVPVGARHLPSGQFDRRAAAAATGPHRSSPPHARARPAGARPRSSGTTARRGTST